MLYEVITRGPEQVMGAGPEIHEDQRPEGDDRQAVAVDRHPGGLGQKVVEHRQGRGGQRHGDRVVAEPPA